MAINSVRRTVPLKKTVNPERVNNNSVNVGVASTLIFDQDPQRQFATIVNDGADTVYVSFGAPAAIGKGIRLNSSGGSLVFGLATDIPFTGKVFGIAANPCNVSISSSLP